MKKLQEYKKALIANETYIKPPEKPSPGDL